MFILGTCGQKSVKVEKRWSEYWLILHKYYQNDYDIDHGNDEDVANIVTWQRAHRLRHNRS